MSFCMASQLVKKFETIRNNLTSLQKERQRLRLAIRQAHVNLGHATVPQMLKAMRVSRASEVASCATRLFRCPDCPRVQQPKQPRPSKLPLTEEFNVHIGIDVFQRKDADGHVGVG